jgi:hypothetical protein
MKYEIIKSDTDDKNSSILKRTDEDGLITFIPLDPANSDYQAYLKSLDEASSL